MSRARIVFAASCAVAGAAVAYAHWQQVEDKRLMHAGVVRDKLREKERKRALAETQK